MYHIKYTLHLKNASGEEVENQSCKNCLDLSTSWWFPCEKSGGGGGKDAGLQKEAQGVCIKK